MTFFSEKKDRNNGAEENKEEVLHIFIKCKSALKRFISGYVCDAHYVDDICQETFLRTYISSLDGNIRKPKSFIFRVAKNLIISDFRKVATRLSEYVDDMDLIEPMVTADDLENNILAQEKLGVMFEAIASLPNKCRQAVVMRKVYGLSTKDIAKRMNISPTTVSNYITRGMCLYNDAVNHYNEARLQSTSKEVLKKQEGHYDK